MFKDGDTIESNNQAGTMEDTMNTKKAAAIQVSNMEDTMNTKKAAAIQVSNMEDTMNTKKAAAIQVIQSVEDITEFVYNDYNKEHERFMTAAAKDPAQAIEWAKDIIVAQVKREQIDKLRARLQEVKDDDNLDIDVVKDAVEAWVADVQKPLLENWLSDSSTSPLTNAVVSSKRDAMAQLLRFEVRLIKGAMETFSEEADKGR